MRQHVRSDKPLLPVLVCLRLMEQACCFRWTLTACLVEFHPASLFPVLVQASASMESPVSPVQELLLRLCRLRCLHRACQLRPCELCSAADRMRPSFSHL